MYLFWRRKCIFIYFGLKRLVTVLLLWRTGFDPGQGLCDTCARESSNLTGFSPRTYVFPCRYHPIILHAHLYKAFNKKKALFTRKLDLNSKEKLVNFYIWSIVLCGAETWALRKVDQKYLEGFEIWCWRWMEKISWIDGVRSEVLRSRVKLERNVLLTVERWKAKWIGHILRRNCLLEHIIEGKVERRTVVTGRRKRRRNQLLDNLRETQR